MATSKNHQRKSREFSTGSPVQTLRRGPLYQCCSPPALSQRSYCLRMAETQSDGKADRLSDPPLAMKGSNLVIQAPKDQIAEVSDASKSPGGGLFGRIKAPPVCNDASLKKESMSTEDLSKFCFPQCDNNTVSTTVSTSSACSLSSRESDHQSHLNAKVMTQKSSRQGRETQRWITDPSTHQRIRLVTGSVPILKDGRILFVSCQSKSRVDSSQGWMGTRRDYGRERSS